MQNKFIVPLLLLASIILVVGFFLITPTFVTTNGDLKTFQDNEVSFTYPSNWTAYDYENPMKIPFLSSTPDELEIDPQNTDAYNQYNNNTTLINSNGTATNASDVLIIKTQISKVKSLPTGISLANAYQSDSLYKLMSSTSSYGMISNRSITVNGHQGYQFVYKVSSSTYQDTWIEYNGHYYRILSQSPTTVYDHVEKDFNNTVNSFKLK